jgi:hypothetical protein
MAFKGESFTFDDKQLIENIKLDAEELGTKTPSQRLRSCLFVLFEKNNGGFKDFNSYYINWMDKMCDIIKLRIDSYQL